jgi:nitroreductase
VNSLLEIMSAHVSVRDFLPEPVDDGLLAQCLSAAQHAASSHNVQAYSLLRVRDARQREQLALLAGAQRQVREAPILLLVCGDTRRHRVICARAGTPYESNLETFLVAVIDAALFAQNLALALETQGLSICYIGGMRNDLDALEACLGVPSGVYPLFGLCAGRARKIEAPRERLPLEAIFHDGQWQSDAEQLAAVDSGDEQSRAAYAARGKAGHTWSGMIARLFSTREREALAAYYSAKGARLD